MAVADALMVARGDLGVEMPLEKVPGLQKRITREARRLGRPVVVATQMLESMISAPAPTRAEVSDVATAVYEGGDAIMLSAESASGKYPFEAVTMMNRIAEEVEQDNIYRSIIAAQRAAPERTGADAVAVAARDMTETLDLKAIVAWTSSGATALRVARERPRAPILALTPNRDTARRLTAVWGVESVITKDAKDVDDMANRACKFAVRQGLAAVGDRILIIAGVPFGTPGRDQHAAPRLHRRRRVARGIRASDRINDRSLPERSRALRPPERRQGRFARSRRQRGSRRRRPRW